MLNYNTEWDLHNISPESNATSMIFSLMVFFFSLKIVKALKRQTQ